MQFSIFFENYHTSEIQNKAIHSELHGVGS